MKATFNPSMRLLLRHEGGFSNNPEDPGGMTNLGVTRYQWEDYVGRQVTEADMRALTPAMVEPFYRVRYWNAISGDQLPVGVDYCVFDTCVNSGPNRAIKLLQDSLGVVVDGHLGVQTISACAAADPVSLISHYTTTRLKFMESLPTWGTFSAGWSRRVNEVEHEAKVMAIK